MLAYESLLSAYVLVGQGTHAASLMDSICEEGTAENMWMTRYD
jgi:pentatricopeptide repeat protein